MLAIPQPMPAVQPMPQPAVAHKRQSRGRKKKEKEVELDSHRLEQRIKQIAYGENTRGYANFLKALARYATPFYYVFSCVPLGQLSLPSEKKPRRVAEFL